MSWPAKANRQVPSEGRFICKHTHKTPHIHTTVTLVSSLDPCRASFDMRWNQDLQSANCLEKSKLTLQSVQKDCQERLFLNFLVAKSICTVQTIRVRETKVKL